MTVEIIEAKEDHLGTLARLHGMLFEPAWDEASFGSILEQSSTTALLAVSDQRTAIGFIVGRIIADEAEILTVGVSPDWQRKGVAGQLVRGMASWLQERGATRIFLEVAIDNDAARRLYLSQGFEEIGRRPGYYERQQRPPIDAAIMAMTISPPPSVDAPRAARL